MDVFLEWSDSFTDEYLVERYNVSLNPDPSNCSNDQVNTSEVFECSGLQLEAIYNFTVSAISDSEGERHSFIIQPQGEPVPPSTLNIHYFSDYMQYQILLRTL